MRQFINIKSRAISIESENIDTDQIIPARFLKTTEKADLGKFMFYNWRYDESGKAIKSIFNDEKNKEAKILVAGKIFGSGSSREHAVWALTDFGFRAVISSEYGDIFYNNALKNGLLCVILKEKELQKLFRIIQKNSNIKIEINLEKQTVEIPERFKRFHFDIDSFRKSCLLLSIDELGYILSHQDKISAYEKRI